jgi:hypothetical protein
MCVFHGNTPAASTHILHGGELILADVQGIHRYFSTKTTLCLVTARIAQMTGRFGHRTAVLACISHDWSSLSMPRGLEATEPQSGLSEPPSTTLTLLRWEPFFLYLIRMARGHRKGRPATPAVVRSRGILMEGGRRFCRSVVLRNALFVHSWKPRFIPTHRHAGCPRRPKAPPRRPAPPR